MFIKILGGLAALRDLLSLSYEIFKMVREWLRESKRKENREKLYEGVKERDTKKIEEAIGSRNAGKLSSRRDGVQVRSGED